MCLVGRITADRNPSRLAVVPRLAILGRQLLARGRRQWFRATQERARDKKLLGKTQGSGVLCGHPTFNPWSD
jgi:hypothetical protein